MKRRLRYGTGRKTAKEEAKEGRIELTILRSFRFSFPKSIPESLSVGELDRRCCRRFDDSWENHSFPFGSRAGHGEGEREGRKEGEGELAK